MTPTFASVPITASDEQLAAIVYNTDGLVPAIIQEHGTGRVLMMAWMNADSLRRTLETGRTWFWSRSRQEYWCKGETSGDRQYVRAGFYDCDGDTLLFVVDQEGRGACHTGEFSCFYRPFGSSGDAAGGAGLEAGAGVAGWGAGFGRGDGTGASMREAEGPSGTEG